MKHLSTTLILLFVLTAAVHAADLEVCGSSVTKTGNISSSAIKSGTVHYNASTKVLTLTNAKIENGSDPTIVNNGIEGLIISFSGTCSLSSPKSCIVVKKRTEMKGDASATASIVSRSTTTSYSAIYVSGAELIFRANGPHFTVKADNTYGIFGCSNNSSKLTLQGAWLKSTGKSGSIDGFLGGITLGTSSTGESIIASPHTMQGLNNVNTYFSKKTGQIAKDEVRIMPKSSYYGIRIKGEALTQYTTSSDVSWSGSYNQSSKVLNVYDIDATNTGFDDPAGVLIEVDGVTVKAAKSGASIKSNVECIVFNNSGTINVPTSYSLNLTAGDKNEVALAIKSGTLTLTGGGNFNTVGKIYGYYNGTTNSFVDDKTPMSIQTDAPAIGAKITFNEVMIKSPSNVELGYDGSIKYKNSQQTYRGSITVGLSQKYDMWVNGILVDESNCYRMGRLFGTKNTLGRDIDEDVVTYDPSIKTLYLNGIMVDKLNEGISTSIEGLTVLVSYANSFTMSGSGTGLSVKGNATIVGSNNLASITLLNCNNGIDINSGTLKIKDLQTVRTGACSGFGIGSTSYNSGSIYVVNSGMDIQGTQACISSLRNMKGWQCGFTSPNIGFYNNYARTGGEYGNIVKGQTISIEKYTATVKVGGTTMTESNFDNLADGVSFDYINHRMTLINASVNGSNGIDIDCPNLLIKILGDNTITTSGTGMDVKHSGSKLYGFGSTLKINAGNYGLLMVGTQSNPATIDNCDITIKATQIGLSANDNTGYCLIRDSKITSDASSYAVGGFEKYQFEGCHVAVPASFTYKKDNNYYKLMNGNQPATHVEIRLGAIPTAMDAITDDVTATEEIFDLQGRRVQDMQRGNVYIVRKGGKVKKSINKSL